MADFEVTTERTDSSTLVICSGELDIATCARLEEVLDLVLEDAPQSLGFDGRGISLLTSSGIATLYRLVQACKERGITLRLDLSHKARWVLDQVGLWWLGVLDDGLAVEDALSDALRAFARIAFEQKNKIINLEDGRGSEYFLG